MALGDRRRLQTATRRAYDAWDRQDWDRAAELLAAVLALAAREGLDDTEDGRSTLAGWVFDLALAHKFRRDWPAAREVGRRAAALAPDRDGEPAWWNLGIAATALRDWPVAREAWTRYGVRLPAGEGPPDGDFGRTPVRIRGQGQVEVVWCARLDPARARVLNVPLPGSGRRWGEVVLHDGVPNGHRVVDGTEHAVFDEIELFEPSPVPVHGVRVRAVREGDLEDLQRLAEASGLTAEVWDTVVPLCQACSEGVLDESAHDHAPEAEGTDRYRVGLAADRAQADRLLAEWVAADPAHRGAGEPEPVA